LLRARNDRFGLFLPSHIYQDSRAYKICVGVDCMHEIRLRKPWTRTSDTEPESVVVDVPDETPLSGFPEGSEACVVYQRGFNLPSGLTGTETVELIIRAWHGDLKSVSINGINFPITESPLVVDLANVMQRFNRIEITINAGLSQEPRLTGEVLLEIKESAESR